MNTILPTPFHPIETKYIIKKEGVVNLYKNNTTGFWEELSNDVEVPNTIYAFIDSASSKDLISRCGVFPLSLPLWGVFAEVNNLCSWHDSAYSNPVYQAFHSRSEADKTLQILIAGDSKIEFSRLVAEAFYSIVRTVGGLFWDNKDTRNK